MPDAGYRAHIPVDGHPIVVQNDQQLLSALSSVGQSLIGQTAGEGPVADEGGHLVILAQGGPCLDHANRHRHRIGGVSGNERVVDALPGLGKRAIPPYWRSPAISSRRPVSILWI